MAAIFAESTIGAAAARLERMAASVPATLEETLALASAQVRDLAVQMMRDATPRRSGALAASTTGAIVLEPGAATITISQPAETQPDQSGNWGGMHYVQFVVKGRPAIRPPFANKKALFGPGLAHPMRGGVAAASANDYPSRVMGQIDAPLSAILHDQPLAATVVRVMRG